MFAGVLLLSTIDTAINVMGLDASYMQVIRGGLMLLAVLLDSVKTSLRRRSTCDDRDGGRAASSSSSLLLDAPSRLTRCGPSRPDEPRRHYRTKEPPRLGRRGSLARYSGSDGTWVRTQGPSGLITRLSRCTPG